MYSDGKEKLCNSDSAGKYLYGKNCKWDCNS
nr:MAG TPA: hypothetical protein [Caudoviricetes sp.]